MTNLNSKGYLAVVNVLIHDTAIAIVKDCDKKSWKYHSTEKEYFAIYEFLLEVGHLDLLRTHFDPLIPEMIVTASVRTHNGKVLSYPPYYTRTKQSTILDSDITNLLNLYPDTWKHHSSKKYTCKNQRLLEFKPITSVVF